jgi:sugar phosphate isomerase/epimerase
MRLGGPTYARNPTPDEWAAEVAALGYRAAYCPAALDADAATIAGFAAAAARADIVIAEVGAWSNPLSADPAERAAALGKCTAALLLAERIGARCAVNIAGSRGPKWDGPDPRDLTPETFDMIVQSVREIIDAVRPGRAFYTLEPMPWMYPDSVESYLELIAAVDRPAFGVHLDPVNMISSPERCFRSGAFIRDCFARLGPRIKSCHAKDVRLADTLTVHLSEVVAGTGCLDYRAFLTEASRLDPDLPVMLEHLETPGEYAQAAAFVRGAARDEGLSL